MSRSEYGPLAASDLTFTQSTGAVPSRAIIRWMRSASLTLDPTATSAASLVPSARTQQPWYPARMSRRATV